MNPSLSESIGLLLRTYSSSSSKGEMLTLFVCVCVCIYVCVWSIDNHTRIRWRSGFISPLSPPLYIPFWFGKSALSSSSERSYLYGIICTFILRNTAWCTVYTTSYACLLFLFQFAAFMQKSFVLSAKVAKTHLRRNPFAIHRSHVSWFSFHLKKKEKENYNERKF